MAIEETPSVKSVTFQKCKLHKRGTIRDIWMELELSLNVNERKDERRGYIGYGLQKLRKTKETKTTHMVGNPMFSEKTMKTTPLSPPQVSTSGIMHGCSGRQPRNLFLQ